MKIDKTNFFKNTLGMFIECDIPETKPDYVSKTNYGAESSAYYYINNGVVRVSDHWGGVASCQWNLNTVNERGSDKCRKTELRAGFISFKELEVNVNLRLELWKAVSSGNKELMIELKEELTKKY